MLGAEEPRSVGGRVVAVQRWARGWSRAKLEELTVDTTGLSPNHRRLIRAGYVATIGLLIAVLVAAVVPQPGVFFGDRDGLGHHAPIGLVWLFAVTFVVGWAFILSGASDAPRYVFNPIVGLCLLELYEFHASSGGQTIVLIGGVILIVVLIGTEPTAVWQNHPVAELAIWLAVLSVALVSSFIVAGELSVPVADMYFAARMVLLFAIPIWIFLGYDSVRAGIDIGRSSASYARARLSGWTYRTVAAVATIAWPLAIVALTVVFADAGPGINGWLAFCFFAALGLAIWCVLDLLNHRWSADRASFVVAINISFAFLSFAAMSAMYNIGLLDVIVSGLQIPALFVFAIVAAYDVVVLGGREAERDGHLVPRGGRVLVYFGVVVLVIGSLAFMYTASDSTASDSPARLTSGGFLIGLVIFGIPHYLTVMERQRERFISSDRPPTDQPGIEEFISRRPSRQTRALWIMIVGPLMSLGVTMVGWFLALSIVGMPTARRLFDRLPTLMTLHGMGEAPPAAPPAPGPPRVAQLPLPIRAVWFVTLGWLLSLYWAFFAWFLAALVVTLPTAMRMLRRLGTVMTLERLGTS